MTRQRSLTALLGTMALGVAMSGATSGAIAQTTEDQAVQSQWFTGSLEAPSPALSKAGQFAVEPYVIFTANTGSYDNEWQHHAGVDNLNQLQSETSIKYALTDRLTLQALPTFTHAWTTHADTWGVGDLPIELEYRFNDQNGRTGAPSLTAAVGIRLPTGNYNRLGNAIDGLGTGAYTLKEGLLLQSLFDTRGGHPVRLRLYGAAFEALGNVDLHDISAYGTSIGFRGHASPGLSGEFGLGAGYAFTQRWVVALDVLDNFADGTRVTDQDAAGLPVSSKGAASMSVTVAPAMEYNWSSRLGIIAGVAFTAAGRNTASNVAPQIALSSSF